MLTRIHVNQHHIKSNRKGLTDLPVLTIKNWKSNRYTNTAIIRDFDGREVARVVYRPEKPLKCGAVCWIETDLPVEVELQENIL